MRILNLNEFNQKSTFSILLAVLSFWTIPTHAQTTLFNGAEVPGVVINHSPASSGIYLASPSIVILHNGNYIASHDETGPNSTNSTSGITRVYRSTDRGQTWSPLSTINGQFWSGMFVHNDELYIMGTNKGSLADIVIRKSRDGGASWTSPDRASTGLLLERTPSYGFHTAPVPIVLHDGRVWRTFEDTGNGGGWANHFRVGMMSAPVDSDLLDASNWTFTNTLVRDKDWLDGTIRGTNIPLPPGGGQGFNGWLEGNAVVDPGGQVVNVIRVDVDRGQPEKAAIARIANTDSLTFDPNHDIIDMPGGSKKFTIRYHEGTGKYWTLANIVTDENQDTTTTPSTIRNIVAVLSSDDLRAWETEHIMIEDLTDASMIGFQYLDWQFDGSDIVAVSRTAFPDGLGGANRQHDANFLTFHRAINVIPEPAGATAILGLITLIAFRQRCHYSTCV